MLGLDNPIHILFVLVVLLLVFGAKRLPEMGKSMGEGLRGFKDSLSSDHSHSEPSPMTHMLDHAPTAASDTPFQGPHSVERVAERPADRVPATPATPAA
jgi:sec-independent protein translocase protein TatA